MSDARAFMRGERARPEAFRRKMKAEVIAVPTHLLPALNSVWFRRESRSKLALEKEIELFQPEIRFCFNRASEAKFLQGSARYRPRRPFPII